MIILVEGTNKTGKSTLIKYLKASQGFESLYDREHVYDLKNPLAKDFLKEKLYEQLRIARVMTNNFIIDRSYLSEVVHGKIWRGYDVEYFEEIDEQFKNIGAKLIYCTDSVENINSRNGEDMSEYCRMYDELFEKCTLDKLKVNIEDPQSNNKLLNFLKGGK